MADLLLEASLAKPPAHLLIAEDEVAVAEVLEDYLTTAGYRITRAADGLEALNALPTDSFDLLLTDIRMPRMDGVTLVRHVRQTHPGMPIVVLSGYMNGRDRKALNDLGVPDEAVLAKPSGLPVLEKVIRAGLLVRPSLHHRGPA